MRDSSPDPARTWPGAMRSTSTTSQPASAQWRASDAPKTPAPTTTSERSPVTAGRLAGRVAGPPGACVRDGRSPARSGRAPQRPLPPRRLGCTASAPPGTALGSGCWSRLGNEAVRPGGWGSSRARDLANLLGLRPESGTKSRAARELRWIGPGTEADPGQFGRSPRQGLRPKWPAPGSRSGPGVRARLGRDRRRGCALVGVVRGAECASRPSRPSGAASPRLPPLPRSDSRRAHPSAMAGA
jgi:hypothetical protein